MRQPPINFPPSAYRAGAAALGCHLGCGKAGWALGRCRRVCEEGELGAEGGLVALVGFWGFFKSLVKLRRLPRRAGEGIVCHAQDGGIVLRCCWGETSSARGQSPGRSASPVCPVSARYWDRSPHCLCPRCPWLLGQVPPQGQQGAVWGSAWWVSVWPPCRETRVWWGRWKQSPLPVAMAGSKAAGRPAPACVLGIDLGTTSVKAALLMGAEQGQVVAESCSRETQAYTSSLEAGPQVRGGR